MRKRKFLAHFHTTGKWLILAAMVGVVAGIGAIAFDSLEQGIRRVALEHFAGYTPTRADGEHHLFEPLADTNLSLLKLVVVLGVGGFLSGVLVNALAPEAEGHGTDAAIEAFHFKRGYIRPIVPIVKLVASALTIGTGGSGGREGPIAQIGAGFGSYLATLLKLPTRDRRILLAVGMGAGIGAIFRAPMAGALFAAEILYRDADLEADVIVPAAVASTIGYSIFSYWLPSGVRFVPLFGERLGYRLNSLFELVPLTALSVILVLVAVLYIKCFYGLHDLVKKSRISIWLRPIMGAIGAGLLGITIYLLWGRDARALAVLGTGYGSLQIAVTNPGLLGVGLLLCIAFGKILTTSATIGSGGSGGVFGPSMVIGGCTGAAVGQVFHQWLPQLAPEPGIYAIVGMAGFFAGAAHAPISTIVMVTELTGDYGLLVPALWVSVLCFLLCQRWTLYHKQLASRLDSPAHRGDFLVDVLEGISVKDVPWKQRITVFQGMPLKEIVRVVAENRQHYFPVVDKDQGFVGIFSTDDIRGHLYNEELWELANARDVMTSRVVSITPEHDLNTALKRFTELNLDELPVLDADNSKKLLGMLRRRDVIACYNQQRHDFQKATDDEEAEQPSAAQ
jgi:CIC family chloride channel protein